jgi:hypothetical protein
MKDIKGPFARLKEIVQLAEALHIAAVGSGWSLDIKVSPTLDEPKQSLFAAPPKPPKKAKEQEPLEGGVLKLVRRLSDPEGVVGKEKVYGLLVESGLSRQQIGQRLRWLVNKRKIKIINDRIMLMR